LNTKQVKFLASPEAKKIVGGYGVVFPAIAEAAVFRIQPKNNKFYAILE
jgi:hypothetical protein